MSATILIIDDLSSRRAVTAEALRRARHDAAQAGAAQGLAAVQSGRPDLVLLEAMPDGGNGQELARRIKRECGYSPPPAVILVSSERIEAEDLIDGRTCDADDYLLRPFDAGELLARVAAALRREATLSQLVASEAKYRQIVEHSHDGIWQIDAEGRLVFVNRRLAAMLGYAAEEMLGRPFTDFLPPELVAWGLEKFATRRRGVGDTYEIRFRHKHGSDLWVRQSVMPVLGEDGTFLGATGITTDISEKKRTEELQEHERRLLRQIVGNDPLDKVLESLCHSLEELSGRVLRCAVVLADGRSGRFACAAAPGLPADFAASLGTICLDDPGALCALAQGSPIILEDLARHPSPGERARAARELGLAGAWIYPLALQDEPLGVLLVFPTRPSAPGPVVAHLMEFVQEVARLAIAHERDARALRESEKRFRDFADMAADWFWEQDAEFRFSRVHYPADRGAPISASIAQKKLGRCRWDLPYVDVPEGFWQEHRRQLAAGQPFTDLPLKLHKPDGSTCHVETSGRPLFDDAGRLTGYRGVGRDVTERKEMLEALGRSEQNYRRLVQDNPLPMWLFDRETLRILEASEGVCALVGCGREEILARKVTDFRLPEDEGRFIERLRGSRPDGGFEDAGLWRTQRCDGSTILTRIGWGSVVYGGRQARIAFLQNVTDQLRAEERIRELNATLEDRVKTRTAELEAANRELDAFNFSVSHDLRAPLRSIEGFSRALLEECAPLLDDTGRDYLRRICAAGQRMGELIDAMYNLSRLSRRDMHVARLDLSELVGRATDELRAREPGREIEVRIADGVVAEGDAGLMRIVLANLLGNAWKYTARTGRAHIEFGAEAGNNGAAVYFVRDNGVGFDMQFGDKLFKLFHRLHRDEDFAGDGVGLATVQRVVRRHDGRIWAEAEKGKGATFFFTLWENEAVRHGAEM